MMKDRRTSLKSNDILPHKEELFRIANRPNTLHGAQRTHQLYESGKQPGILLVSSYPPRKCGIATYSQDLLSALNLKFSSSFSLKVCAIEAGQSDFVYPPEVKYKLNTLQPDDYKKQSFRINRDASVNLVLIQHEFGFFRGQEDAFLQFLSDLTKPVAIVFHSILPDPSPVLMAQVNKIAAICSSVVVMTHNSEEVLVKQYGIPQQKISVIAHGTHLVPHLSEKYLKEKYGLSGRKVLSTFGLLGPGKSIETTLNALPSIIRANPQVIFLVMGKTHPEILSNEGEKYREMLMHKVAESDLGNHVKFIDEYLDLNVLLEYLQLTDIYLFTSTDPNQAVSGTFSYAMSCACPIISTPIPHAKEVLTRDTGFIIDFRSHRQLARVVKRLLRNEPLRMKISVNALQKIISTAWENSAVAHAMLFNRITDQQIPVNYNLPVLTLNHLKRMTTDKGIVQFAKINLPDLNTGYTLDDNARALKVAGMYFRQTLDDDVIGDIRKYLGFVGYCQQPDGRFLNYVDKDGVFTRQNRIENLQDANGRAIWALGYTISLTGLLPVEIISEAEIRLKKAINAAYRLKSPRAMAFAVKGLYHYHRSIASPDSLALILTFAARLVKSYIDESENNWEWFEGSLTYANSILPEAMLYAWLVSGEDHHLDIALESLNFLLSVTFNEKGIQVISNRKWMIRGKKASRYGEQPIDVANTIMTLSRFYDELKDRDYSEKMEIAFDWFLGRNHLQQIIYNPCTGGCYDGLEEFYVNLNQGAESTVSYLLARMTMEKYQLARHVTSSGRNRSVIKSGNKVQQREMS